MQSYKRVLVAYSGGVDSSFLLRCCSDFLGCNNVLAVTAVSPTYTQRELKMAQEVAGGLGIAHRIIHTEEFDNPNFKANPENRCYYCKSELFSKLKEMAKIEAINFVLDGSNQDDLKDYRPGTKAKKESFVHSPLAEAALSKEEIRQLSKKLGLKTWNIPQAACLASRFAYGQEITVKDLSRVEKAEEYIRSLGIKMVRVRHYQLPDRTLLARIEVDKKDIRKLTASATLHGGPATLCGGHSFRHTAWRTRHALWRAQLTAYLKKIGYNYVTLDLEGYRSGSMNIGITGGDL